MYFTLLPISFSFHAVCAYFGKRQLLSLPSPDTFPLFYSNVHSDNSALPICIDLSVLCAEATLCLSASPLPTFAPSSLRVQFTNFLKLLL